MNKELSFALYAIKKNIQSSAELRTSFLMNIFGMVINNTAFILLWAFFVQSVGVIGGWRTIDVIALQGFNALAYGIVMSVAVGIRKLPDYVASGAFDRFMLSPKNLLLRVATSSFLSPAFGDIVFGLACLIIFAFMLPAAPIQLVAMALLIVLTTVAFLAMTITIYSLSFFFIDADAVTGGIFELFLTPSMFHGGAFQGAMRFIFTFVIPSLVIGTLPVEALRDLSLLKLSVIALLALIWLALSIKIFYKAVRRYESSNFMTFGS